MDVLCFLFFFFGSRAGGGVGGEVVDSEIWKWQPGRDVYVVNGHAIWYQCLFFCYLFIFYLFVVTFFF